MADVTPRTVGQSLYWSYANLAMAAASCQHGEPEYQKTDYIVRNKIYYGLSDGKLNLGSFLEDEKWKMAGSGSCCYCNSQMDLTLDHLIPQFKGGKHSADNLVVACRFCNSSKKSLDLLEWQAVKGQSLSLALLRRYLKLAIVYCSENGFMDIPLEQIEGVTPEPMPLFDGLEKDVPSEGGEGSKLRLPFAITLIPHSLPNPGELAARSPMERQEVEKLAEQIDWERAPPTPGPPQAWYDDNDNPFEPEKK